jgi:hypothetical protein
MIQDAGSLEMGVLHSSLDANSMAVHTSAAATSPSAEHEITRLTWSVLDGSASLADRQRLAELVDSQHAVRRRFDR